MTGIPEEVIGGIKIRGMRPMEDQRWMELLGKEMMSPETLSSPSLIPVAVGRVKADGGYLFPLT